MCLFHLPEDAKAAWTDEQIKDFHGELKKVIRIAIEHSSLLDLSGVIIPGVFKLGNSENRLVLPNSLFLKCAFADDVEFENVAFSGWVYFNETQFKAQVLLNGVRYEQEASFDDVNFGPNVHLGHSHFKSNAYFQGATFASNAWCSDIQFKGRAWFQQATFGGIAYFERCRFGGEADFSTRRLTDQDQEFQDISFEQSVFEDRVSFINRTFSGSTNFAGATFCLAPEFYGSRLHEDTDLTDTLFLDRGETKRGFICGVAPRPVNSARAYRALKRAMESLRNAEDEARFFALEKEVMFASEQSQTDNDSELKWDVLGEEDFERLVFDLISDTEGYENVRWLQHTNAPDRGRDLSAERVLNDELCGVRRLRIIIQCKHWLTKSVNAKDIGETRTQIELWQPPRVDVLIIATSGRFTADAIDLTERHNQGDKALHIVLWPETHLKRLIQERPKLLANFTSK